jgi:hypothetical protein
MGKVVTMRQNLIFLSYHSPEIGPVKITNDSHLPNSLITFLPFILTQLLSNIWLN